MVPWEARAKLLKSESQKFLRYLADLPDDSWSRQSACDLWRVEDVVSHLIGNAEFYTSTVERGLTGENHPPAGRPTAGTGHPSSGASSIAQGAIANRERLSGHLLEALEDRSNRLVHLLVKLSPEDRVLPCYHPGSLVPAGNFVDLRFKELALHQWDIRSTLEPGTGLVPDSLPSIVVLMNESLASGSIRWAFWPGPVLEQPVRYRFDVSEPFPFRGDIVVGGDRFHFEQSSGGDVAVNFRCDTETLALIMSGRIDTSCAVSNGSLEIEGDGNLAERFSQWFKGI